MALTPFSDYQSCPFSGRVNVPWLFKRLKVWCFRYENVPVFVKNLDAYLCHHLRRLPAEYSRRGINTLDNASRLTNNTIINYQVEVWVHSTEPFRFCHKRMICFFATAYPKYLVRAPILTASTEVTSLFIAVTSYCAGRGPSCVACYQQELR